MGYKHIALGGLVPRRDDDILEILSAVRCAIQSRASVEKENLWLHLFGVLRPKLQPIFKELGISSFDSASYFRKAWLRSDQNYLAADGLHWYGTIRIPISTSKAMRDAAAAKGISTKELVKLEQDCLEAIDDFDGTKNSREQVLRSIDRYDPLLQRRGKDNHSPDRHSLLLRDKPWEQCNCPFCRSAGIHVVVFRGASRNKRRGLHNTWVFYHRILNGNAIPSSSLERE